MTLIQPIHYTHRPDQWHAFLRALGFEALPGGTRQWSEFGAHGMVAIHVATADAPAGGVTDLHLLVEDPRALSQRLKAEAITHEVVQLQDVGDLIQIELADGPKVSASHGERVHTSGGLAVMPIWYGESVTELRRALEIAGLKPRLASDSGEWMDFQAPDGGLVAFHRGEAHRVELALEYRGDIESYADELTGRGLSVALIDEAYNRTLLVRGPEGVDLWINGTVDDLHGYTRF